MNEKQPSPLWQALKGGVIIAAVMVPIIITILVLSGYRGVFEFGVPGQRFGNTENELICIDADTCIIQVGNKWFLIADVLDPENVPEQYRFDGSATEEPVEEPTQPQE